MFRRIFSALMIVVIAVAANAAQRSLNLNGKIKEIDVSAGVDVKYIPSTEKPRVLISGPEDRIARVEVSLKSGKLSISSKPEDRKLSNGFGFISYGGLKGVKITLYAPHVGVIKASSGAELKCSTPISVPQVNSELSASSGSDISLKGLSCLSVKCTTSSGADIDLDNLICGEVMLKSSSGSDIEVEHMQVTKVSANASSGGDISIGGQAGSSDLTASSGGSIKARKLDCSNNRVNSSSGGSVKTM